MRLRFRRSKNPHSHDWNDDVRSCMCCTGTSSSSYTHDPRRPRHHARREDVKTRRLMAIREGLRLKRVRCICCGIRTMARKATICDDCAVCRCGSGKPPGVCHGVSRSGFRVEPRKP